LETAKNGALISEVLHHHDIGSRVQHDLVLVVDHVAWQVSPEAVVQDQELAPFTAKPGQATEVAFRQSQSRRIVWCDDADRVRVDGLQCPFELIASSLDALFLEGLHGDTMAAEDIREIVETR
jgi:hypothetical protein